MTIAVTSPGTGAPAAAVTSPVLFFDGECGFCDRAVRFTMEHDRSGRIQAAALQGESAAHLLAPFASVLRTVDSTLLYLPGEGGREAKVLLYSDAALAVLRLLGGGWAVLGVLGHVVPRWIRDAAYKAFAKRRFQLFGRVEACQLWPASWRARMLP